MSTESHEDLERRIAAGAPGAPDVRALARVRGSVRHSSSAPRGLGWMLAAGLAGALTSGLGLPLPGGAAENPPEAVA